MTRITTIVFSALVVLSVVAVTAAIGAPISGDSGAVSTSESSPSVDSGERPGTVPSSSAVTGDQSPGALTDATTDTSDGSTNDSSSRRTERLITDADQQADASQPPYTASLFPFQPDIKWGGRAVAVDVHPRDSEQAIVASESGGLFETTDGGSTWTHLDGRYPHRLEDVEYADRDPNTIVLAAETDSRNLRLGGRVVSGGGIWVSRDGGDTWTKPASAEPPASSRCRAAGNVTAKSVAFEPGTPNVYVGTQCGLAVSTDLGRTWTHKRVDGRNRQVGTVIAPAEDTIDICTRNDGHFRYRPSTDSWEATTEQLPWRSCHYSGPHSLAASPSDPDVLFAVVPVTQDGLVNDSVNKCVGKNAGSKRELFESDDGGRTWTDLNAPGCTGNREPFVATSSAAASNGDFTVYVGKGVNTHRQNCTAGAGGLRCSSSGGDWDQQVGDNIDVDHADHTDIAFPPDSVCPAFLTNDGGVEATSDCGKSWDNVGNSTGFTGFNALQLYTIEGRTYEQKLTDLYFGTQDNGQWAGTDLGRRWDSGPGNEGGWMGLNRTGPSQGSGEPIMVEAESGHSKASASRLARIGDWPNPPGVGPGNTAGSKAYYVDTGVYLQWNGTSNGDERTLWLTTNTGAANSWTPTVTLEDVAMRDTPVVGPPTDPTVYVPTDWGVKKVTNVRGSGVPTATSVGRNVDPATHIRGEGTFDWNTVFAADPSDSNFLIAADEDDNVMKVSRNGGQSWHTDPELTRLVTDNGGFRMDPPGSTTSQATEIAFDPENSDRIFVGTEANGVIHSADGGQTWGRIAGSRNITAVSGFFFEKTFDGDGFRDVYVATYGRGLWRIADFNNLRPVPEPDRFDRGGLDNDDPSSARSVAWTHTSHLRCPDETSLVLGQQTPGDDCSAALNRTGRVTPLAAKEVWTSQLASLSLDGSGDRDFYRLATLPDPTTHRDIKSLPQPECGRQSTTIANQSKVVQTEAWLSVVVTPTGNSLSRTPVRTADGATPIEFYNHTGDQLNAGIPFSDGNKLVSAIWCPNVNGLNNLTVSFGEGIASNSGGYEIEFRYRIDIERPGDIRSRIEQAERIREIVENAGKYERLFEKFRCGPTVPGGNPCVYRTDHPVDVPPPEDDIVGGFCEEAICRQRWEVRRVEERAFELSVLGNENIDIELREAGPDGELVARSEPIECVGTEAFRELAVAGGHGDTVQEVGAEGLVRQMGQPCDGSGLSGSATASAFDGETPEGEAPIRHRLGVDSLEPGVYQLVITGPRSAYWIESVTPSDAELDESDAESVPRAAFDADPVEAVTEEPVIVDASRTQDLDGSIETYEWQFGEGETARRVTTRAATATHTFLEPGEYPVTLTVTDDDGNTDTVTRGVFVSPAPAGDTEVRLEPARRTTGDCPVVYDNRIPIEEPGEGDESSSEDVEVGEEGFEEDGLYCTVYDPGIPRVGADEEFRYDVVVKDANTGIGAGGFTVEASDGSAINITEVSLGPDVDAGREADVRLPADAVEVTAEGLTEVLGDARGRAVLATITVDPEGAGGTTDLLLSDTRLRNPRGDDYTVTAQTGSSLEVERETDDDSAEPTIRLEPPAATVRPDGTTTLDVVVAGIERGVGSYDLTIDTSDRSRVRLVAAETRIGGSGEIDLADDGSSVRLAAFEGETNDTGTVRIGTITVAGGEPGEATLSVAVESLSDEPGEQYPTAGTEGAMITVEEPAPPSFAVRIDETNSPVTEGDTLDVTATVENTGEQQGTQEVELTVGGTQRDATTVSLAGGESTTVELSWATADGDAGTYTATVASDDDADSDTVTVEEAPDLPPIAENLDPPTDPDDDGKFEDVNGDGEVNIGDVQALFANSQDPVVQDNVAAFDFNDDGSVNIGDVQALFARGIEV